MCDCKRWLAAAHKQAGLESATSAQRLRLYRGLMSDFRVIHTDFAANIDMSPYLINVRDVIILPETCLFTSTFSKNMDTYFSCMWHKATTYFSCDIGHQVCLTNEIFSPSETVSLPVLSPIALTLSLVRFICSELID